VPDEARRIFEKFHRAARGRRHRAGVGHLSGITAQGRLWVDHVGSGAAFASPCRSSGSPTLEQEQDERWPRRDRSGSIVLLIEDELPMRRFLRAAQASESAS
jgi:hypothetical protein